MADTKPRHYLTGIIVFTIIITGVITMINYGRLSDSDFVDDEKFSKFEEAFNRTESLNTAVDSLESNITGHNQVTTGSSFINILFGKGFNILSSLFATFDFTNAIITSTSRVFGVFIPEWLPPLLILLLTSMLIFSIVSAILQRDI
jgi:hypothetical protein